VCGGWAGWRTLFLSHSLKQVQHLLVIDPDLTLNHLTDALREETDIRVSAGEYSFRTGAKSGNYELRFSLIKQQDPWALGSPIAKLLGA
jgi:hypothetical protein